MFVNAASVKPRSRDMNRPIVLGTERLIILDCSAVIIKRGYGDVKEGGSKNGTISCYFNRKSSFWKTPKVRRKIQHFSYY